MFDFKLSLVAFLACLPIMCRAGVQVSAPNCLDSFAWSSNSLGQNPCVVAAYLLAPCNNNEYYIPPLVPQQYYSGPNDTDGGNACMCNTVTYCLISACVACQGEQWTPYYIWAFNCTAVAAPRTFPEPVPLGTRVPNWAFNNPTISGSWNETLAQSAGDLPEVTGSASVVPSSTSGTQSTNTSSPVASSRGSSDTAVIAGGVVGGVVGIALVISFVAWLTIRRGHARAAPPMEHSGGLMSDMAVVPYSQATKKPRLYDPSDPSTYPTNAPSSAVYATDSRNQHSGSSSNLQSNRKAHGRVPEI